MRYCIIEWIRFEQMQQHRGTDMTEELKLSISLMTSNRKDTIRKCLDSLAHLRKVIPSELVIVDTGCDEEMLDIIRPYADQIVPFTWCNDFAAARNAGMAACTGNWYMFVDDDEWFEDTKEIEDFFLKGDCNRFGEACYIQRNYGKKDGSIYQDAYVKRIIRLDKNTHFKGRIHEALMPSYAEKTRLNSYVHHYGYAFEDQEENVRHSYRNIVLLREGIADEPENVHWRVQLALEYIAVCEYRSLQELCEESIELLKDKDGCADAIYRGSFYDGLVYALYHMERFEVALSIGEQFAGDHRNTRMAQMYLYRWLTELYLRSARFDDARNTINKYQELKKEYATDPDSFWDEDMIIARTAVDDGYRERMAELLVKTEAKETETGQGAGSVIGEKYHRLIELEKQLEMNLDNEEICLELADCYYQLGENSRLERLAHRCLGFVSDELYQLFVCFYVDAVFSECRYAKAATLIREYGENPGMSDVALGMLFCEGCISEHRLQHDGEAEIYGKAYLERFIKYYQMTDAMPSVIAAAYQMKTYELVKESLNNKSS